VDALRAAYFAGFFDGEGSISITFQQPPGRRRTHVLQVAAGQCDRAAIEAMRDAFGGRVYPRRSEPGRRPFWHWIASAAVAEAALREMLPYLVVKREQATLALRFRELYGPEHGTTGRGRRASPELVAARELCRVQMVALNAA
jgi:hypothetical protein